MAEPDAEDPGLEFLCLADAAWYSVDLGQSKVLRTAAGPAIQLQWT